MKSREKAFAVKEKNDNCTVIEVTTSYNGYPENVHSGVIGFENIDEARRVADEFDGQVVEFEKRDGWQLWKSNGRACEKYNIFDELSHDYDEVYPYGTDEVTILERAKEIIEDTNDLYTIKEIAMKAINIANYLEQIEEDEAVCVCNDEIEIRNLRPMEYSRDTHNYAIGVEFFAD